MAVSPSSHIPVAILGAGLTGMSAALTLQKCGVPFRLFEKLATPGGHVVTVEENGFRFDRTGHLLHLRDPAMREQVLGWLGDDWLEVERRSRIWSHGVYTRYPFQANTFGLPPAVAHECLVGFVRALLSEGRQDPRTFEEFCLAHFGEGFSKHFLLPYNARLWGVSPQEITSAWCSRFVPLPKLEDVLAGAVGLNDRELGYNTRFVYPRRGIGQLSTSMARELPTLEYSRAPQAVDVRNKTLVFDNEQVTYDVLISTAPLQVLGKLLVDPPPEVQRAQAQLRCTHLYYLDVAASVPSGTDHHWVYVPEVKYPFYRIGCYSHFSPELAPPGQSCFYVELADRTPPDLATLLPVVARSLVEMGVLPSPDAISFARVRRIDFAYVVFDHHYFSSLEVLHPFLKEHAILSTGRYGGWNYSSMEDALLFGRDAAEEVLVRQGGHL